MFCYRSHEHHCCHGSLTCCPSPYHMQHWPTSQILLSPRISNSPHVKCACTEIIISVYYIIILCTCIYWSFFCCWKLFIVVFAPDTCKNWSRPLVGMKLWMGWVVCVWGGGVDGWVGGGYSTVNSYCYCTCTICTQRWRILTVWNFLILRIKVFSWDYIIRTNYIQIFCVQHSWQSW